MPTVKRRHWRRGGLSWELQALDGTAVLKGGYPALTARRLEITTSDGGKLEISLSETAPGVVYMDVRTDNGDTRGAIEVQPREGRFDLTLFGYHGTNPNRVTMRAKLQGKRR